MTDLFEGNAGDHTGVNTPDPNKDFLSELVGEDKKFKTVQDLAKGKAESDQFIERLKSELEGLRNELQTRTTLEQALDRITQAQNPRTNVNSETNQTRDDDDADRTALTPEQIAKIVEEKVSQHERQRQAQANLGLVKQKLTEAFGSNYVNKLNEEAANLGLSKEQVNAMAASQPQVLLRLLNADKPPQRNTEADGLFTPPRSAQTPPANRTPTDRTKAFYDNLKRTNPSEYWKPQVQNQMHKDALRLGPAFFTS